MNKIKTQEKTNSRPVASSALLRGLNKEQKEAVEYENGPLLVLAGAGSGKTKVLTHRVAWFIDQKKAGAENVLLLTFTKKAAGEMKERVLRLTKKAPGFAGTFHSFCVRILRIDGQRIDIPKNFLIYDEQDSREASLDNAYTSSSARYNQRDD